MDEIPKFKHSLRVGDKIQHKRWENGNCEDRMVKVTVVKIGDSSNSNDTLPAVTTTNLYAILDEDINPDFCILESVHDDAPPVGQWTNVNEVNLIRGQLKTDESTTRSRKARGSANDIIRNSIGGDQVAFKAVCLERRKKMWKKMDDDVGSDSDSDSGTESE